MHGTFWILGEMTWNDPLNVFKLFSVQLDSHDLFLCKQIQTEGKSDLIEYELNNLPCSSPG